MRTRFTCSAIFLPLAAVVLLTAHSANSAGVDFIKDVQPVLEMNCVSCHAGETPEGGLDLSSRATAFESGNSGPAIIPEKPDESALYTLTIVPKDDSTLMPPAKQGGPLDKRSIEILRQWIADGA